MKIGFIAEVFNEKLTGIGNTSLNLINSLNSLLNNDEIYLLNYKQTLYCPNETILIPNSNLFFKKHLWYLSLPKKIKNFDFDIVHNPTQLCTFFKFDPKNVITVHDITPLLLPETHPFGISAYNKIFFSHTLKNADEIIAVSNNTKKDLMEYFDIQPSKINVIYWGIEDRFKVSNIKDIEKVKLKFNLNYPYILYLGTIEPRKNICTLLKSFQRVKEKNIHHKLVIIGGKGWGYKKIFKTVEELRLQKDVIFLGYVSQEEIPKIYGGADIFVYPSLYEGFGIPPLEAMACGCPVIVSNRSSLPEIVGNGGIMVDPLDYLALAEKIDELINDFDLRNEMIKMGITRAKTFSWIKCAKETKKVYENVYS